MRDSTNKRNSTRPRRSQSGQVQGSTGGFTLVELLVVISVLGVLAGIVVFSVGGISDRGQSSACAQDVRTLRTAEESQFAKSGTYLDGAGLVSAGFLSAASTLHTVTVSSGAYTISGTGTCASTTITDSFEGVPAAPAGGFHEYAAGTTLGAWTINSGSIDVVDYQFWANASVTGLSPQSTIDLHGSSPGSIQRDFTGLTVGTSYTLTFKYAHNQASGSVVRVRIGNLDTNVTAVNNAYSTQWLTATLHFTATAATQTLRFDGSGPSNFGGVTLDDVAIS